jgi:hypothetical protein
MRNVPTVLVYSATKSLHKLYNVFFDFPVHTGQVEVMSPIYTSFMVEMMTAQQLVLLNNSNVILPPDNPTITVEADAVPSSNANTGHSDS